MKYYGTISTLHFVLLGVLVGSLALGLGVIIGYFGKKSPQGPCLGGEVPDTIISDGDPDVAAQLHDEIKAANLRNNLLEFTRSPHVGGTPGSHDLADNIAKKWREYGLDQVELKSYEVLLSFPDTNNPNSVKLYENNILLYTSADNEKIPGANNTGIIQPYNAYAPNGTFTGDMIYVNYCRREDFDYLAEISVNVSDKIVICRYGQIFRGTKVAIASSHSAKGVILYNDPADYAIEGVDNVYPNSWWLPPTGVQRGTVYAGEGDPLTPGYPSTKTAYRLSEADADGLPDIPSHPLGYGDAYHFLKELSGPNAPTEWQGGLNFTYKIGPLKTNKSIELRVNNKNSMAKAVNVIGSISGAVEPERYVMVGSHRDAWAFGALDPTTGTAVLVELARAMGKLKAEGWRPRRSIVFCSWGAEEFGLMGSYEWVEENVKKISERTVAYLNLDTVVEGNHSLEMAALPILYNLTFEAAKTVETANKAGMSLYEEWLQVLPDPHDNTKPEIALLGSGSDHAAFYVFAGVPCIDFLYTYDKKAWKVIDYPVYHTGIEIFKLYETFIDPNFLHMRSVTQYAGEILRRLGDSYLIPYDVVTYAETVILYVDAFISAYGGLVGHQGISLDSFKEAAESFKENARSFAEKMKTMNRNNPMEVRAYNDAMMMVERSFLDPQGLPGRPLFRHVLFAPSLADSYSGSSFPGLTDALYKIEDDPDQETRWKVFRQHLATVIFILDGAAQHLSDFHNI